MLELIERKMENLTEFKDNKKIQSCPHNDELAVYCPAPYSMAFCNDCFFEQEGRYGKGMTLKKAAAEQIARLEQILNQVGDALGSCSDLQNSVLNQEGLEEELLKKVNR